MSYVMLTVFPGGFLVISFALALTLLFQGAARPGTVTGQLRTLDGAPAISVRVAAMPVPTSNAKPEDGVQYFTYPPPEASTLTDTQGRYRLNNLPPGRYYIMAGAFGEPTYYPGKAEMESATAVTLGPGSTSANLDFKLLRLLGGKITGRVSASMRDPQLKVTLLGGKLEELLDAPIAADGTYEFGHVLPGSYLVGLFPRPAGFSSVVVKVGDKDVTGLELTVPPTRNVTGKIVVDNGPLPHALLAFSTPQSYVSATLNPDGTFSAKLQAARHRVELAGMQVGYSVASVRIGSQDATEGFAVGNADVSGVVITVAAPSRLPKIHGAITGLPAARYASTRVEIAGEINGSLQATIQQDGSFEFPAVIPGLYRLKLTQVPELPTMNVVVAGWDTTEVKVAVPAR
jgi:hypothetical protein